MEQQAIDEFLAIWTEPLGALRQRENNFHVLHN